MHVRYLFIRDLLEKQNYYAYSQAEIKTIHLN